MLGKLKNKAKKFVKRSMSLSKAAKMEVAAPPQAPALDHDHQQLLLLANKTASPPLYRSKSEDITTVCPPTTTMQPAMARAQSAQARCALPQAPAAGGAHLQVEASKTSSSSSYHTAFSVNSHTFDLINIKTAASRPASPASTEYYSMAASAASPRQGSRAASPVGSEEEGQTSADWSIPAGRALSYLAGYNPSQALPNEEEAYEAFLAVAANTPAPSWVAKLPGKIDSTSLAAPAPCSGNSGAVYLYNVNSSSAAPRAESPEVTVGCFSAFSALAKALLLLGKRPRHAAEWQPEATTTSSSSSSSSTKTSFLAPFKALGKKVEQAASAVKEELCTAGSSVRGAWGSATNSVCNSFKRTRSSIGGGVDAPAAGLRSTNSSVVGVLEAAGGSFKRRMSKAGSSMGEVFESTTSSIKRRLSSAGSSLGGALDEGKAASDQWVNSVSAGLTKAAAKVKAGAKALKPQPSKKAATPHSVGVSYGSEVVVGRFGQQWGIVVSPGLAAPVAAA